MRIRNIRRLNLPARKNAGHAKTFAWCRVLRIGISPVLDQYSTSIPRRSLVMSEKLRTLLDDSLESQQPAISTTSKLLSRTAKRKCNSDGDYDLEAAVENSGKRKRSRKSKEPNSNEDHNLDLDKGLNVVIAKLDNRLLADYVAKRTKRFFPDLSLFELEDKYVSGNV